MKSKSNKRKLFSVLGTFNRGETTIMKDDGAFRYHEADVTIVLVAAKSGQSVICILSDNIDVFVLLVYQADVQCKVQMEHWDGSVLDINATCTSLGQKCLQLQGIPSHYDTTSYHYRKGKVTALNILYPETTKV